MAIYNMTARIMKAKEMVKKQSKKLHLKAVKDYKRNIQDIDDLLNELFGIGVMFDPDYIKEFRKTGKLPDQFINASDGTLITPQDEKYKEIVEIIEEAEARRGETFGNKPVVPKAAEPVVSEQAPPPVTEAPPEQELEYEPEDYDVTTPFDKLPLAIKEALREEHKKSIDENNGMQTDIQDWMRESVIAASIIAGNYKPSTYKKEDGEPEEIKEENLITPKTSKSFTTSTPATENIYKQYEEEGWEVDPNDNSKYINSKKPESERESVSRVSSILGKVFEESNYLRATQGRGNVVDTLLRWFSSPSSNQYYFRDTKLPIGISPKDAIINMVTLGASQAEILETLGGENLGDSGGLIGVFLKTDPILSKNKIKVEPAVNQELAKVLFELATRTRGFTWHTNVPAMVGTVNGKRYGGTIDLLFEKDGKFYIADIKTSKKARALDPRYAESDKVQLNAYADIVTQITGIPIEGLFTINITAEISSDNKTILNAKLVTSKGVDGKEKVLNRVDRQPVDEVLKQKQAGEEKSAETPVTTDAIDDINKRRQEALDRETPVKNENITVDFGGGVSAKYKVITYKDGSVKISTVGEKAKRYNELYNEIFQDYAKIDFESDAKGVIKTEVVIDDYTDKQSQEIKAAKEKTINAKYDEELVDEYRKQEIVEFRNDVENAESFIVNGRIDSKKVKASGNAKAKEIYDRYDKLITLLLPTAPVSALEGVKPVEVKQGRVSLEDQYKNIINTISDVPSLLNFIAAYEANPNIIDANVATVDDVAEMLKKKVKEIDDSPQTVSIINESIDEMVNQLKKEEEVPGVNAEDKQSAQDVINQAAAETNTSAADAHDIVTSAEKETQKEVDDDFDSNLNCE